jgi:HNH endonuclease
MARKRSLRIRVAERAGNRCEYCRIRTSVSSVPFQLDHVIAEKHSGAKQFTNLAWACLHCNSFKGPNLAGVDHQTGEIVRLFNPQSDDWDDHFQWQGPVLIGRTAIARVTIDVLRISFQYRVALRESLMDEGAFDS